MLKAGASMAEIEYAVRLAVLNFQTEFMGLHCSRAHVHIYEDLMEIVLTRSTSIPAEEMLTQSAEGRSLLRKANHSLFLAGETQLRDQLEQALCSRVHYLCSHFDSLAFTTTIIVKMAEPLGK